MSHIKHKGIHYSIEGVRGLTLAQFKKKFGVLIKGSVKEAFDFVKSELKKHPKPKKPKAKKED
jgi:hypothetical protein